MKRSIQERRAPQKQLPWSCFIDCRCGQCIKLIDEPTPRIIELEY